MRLTIISPQKKKMYVIDWIECKTIDGTLVICLGHVPTVLLLADNESVMFKLDTGKQQTLFVASGIAEVFRDSITLIVSNVS